MRKGTADDSDDEVHNAGDNDKTQQAGCKVAARQGALLQQRQRIRVKLGPFLPNGTLEVAGCD
jgi:hypothetical protein